MKDLDPEVIRSGLMGLADNIVNPKCDECGRSVTPDNPLSGPHICSDCYRSVRQGLMARYGDYLSQERPTRRVHVVKLPECMQKR